MVLHVYILKDFSICPGPTTLKRFMGPAQAPLGASLHPAHSPEPQTAWPKAPVLVPGKLCSNRQSPSPSLALLDGWTLDLYHRFVSGPDLLKKVENKKPILIYFQASLVHFGYVKGTSFLKPHPNRRNFFHCFHCNFLLHSVGIYIFIFDINLSYLF